jgi:hypothetical protein
MERSIYTLNRSVRPRKPLGTLPSRRPQVLEEAVERTRTRLLADCVLPSHWHVVSSGREKTGNCRG